MSVPSTKPWLGLFRQYTAAIIAALSMLMLGMSLAWPSPVLPMMLRGEAPVIMNSTQISWLVSLMFFGNTLSPIPVGWLMDRFGRKRILYVMNVLPTAAWILAYLAESPWHLYLSRFLNGLWAGTSYTVCAVYIGEIAEPSIRGSLSNFNNLMRSVGGLLVFVVGPYVSYTSLALFCGLVPAVFFLAASVIPESPYFLLMRGRREDAKEALKWLRGKKEGQALEMELVNIEKAVIAQTKNSGTIKDIFTDIASRRAFLITMILCYEKNMSGFDVMMAYLSITLPGNAFHSLGPNECVIIFGVITVVSCVASVFILDRFRRRVLLTVSSLGCALMTLVAGCWFFLDEQTDVDVQYSAQLPFYCFAVHAVVYSVGLGPIVASVKGELFSANIKGLCSALITIIFAVLSAISTKIYLTVANSIGMYANYFIYAVGCVIGLVFILVCVVETRGKSLHEIQIKLSERKQPPNSSVQRY